MTAHLMQVMTLTCRVKLLPTSFMLIQLKDFPLFRSQPLCR